MSYGIVFFALVILSFLYLKIADKLNIIDKPNHRSSHSTPTIRGGGILFYTAILIYYFISDFQYPYFVLGVSLIAIISFIDDIITLSSTLRLPFQFLAIGLCLFQIGFVFDDFLILIPLLIIGVGFINIYNFMDGINGITGLYSLVILGSLFFINLKENIVNDDLFIYTLFSLIIFGYFNFRKKAKMFAGDIGSITIAILIFFIGALMIKELESPLILLSIVVYATDAILTIFYRKFTGKNITKPHKDHIYQKLVDILKLSHLRVSFIYAFLQVLINILVYKTYKLQFTYQLIIFSCITVLFILIYFFLFKKIEKAKIKNALL